MNEFELIARLTKSLPTNQKVLVGAGDDCAVLDFGLPDQLLLFKTDAVVEGIHFTKDTPPEKIGRKALARCLSDFAAMAGTPTAAVVTIGLPEHFKPEMVVKIYDGLNALAQKHGVALADASLRWGRLWRQGIPYRTLLLNGVNHPDERGMKMFADSLMTLFPKNSP